MKISDLEKSIFAKLDSEGKLFEAIRSEIRLIICETLGISKLDFIAHPERVVSDALISKINLNIQRRINFEPIAYIFNKKEFYGREFYVTPSVLIPRPETEELIQLILKNDLNKFDKIFDLGTGSGCIVNTLILESKINSEKFIAVDLSYDALLVCQKNMNQLLEGKRFNLICSNLLSSFSVKKNSLIIANLPYIGETEKLMLDVDLFEPQMALRSGEKGLDLIIQLIEEFITFKNSKLYLEIGKFHSIELKKLFPNLKLIFHKDYSGVERFLELEV